MAIGSYLKTCFLFSALVFALPGLGAAQDQDAALKDFANSLPDQIKRQIGQRPDMFLRSMASTMFGVSPDGIVTKEAIDIYSKRQMAGLRARSIMQVLANDLDGDGTVSAQEIERQMPYLPASQRGELTLTVIENDTNSDGALSLSEILGAARKSASQRSSGTQRTDLIMAFDHDGDGKVDLEELSKVVDAVDPAALEPASPTRRRAEPSSSLCKVPKPASDSDVVFLSGYRGAAVSTLAVSGQDVETSVATVIVDEGLTPLYIFATAFDSIIWKFEGATERVRRLIVQPRSTAGGPGAAVAGIDKDKITFVPPGACIDGYVTSTSAKERVAINQLSRILGRNFSYLAVSYTIDDLLLPPSADQMISGKQDHPYRTPVTFSIGENSYEISARGMTLKGGDASHAEPDPNNRRLIRELMRFYPGGLIPMASSEVHAEKDIHPYTILPQQAGLLQLVAEGRIVDQAGTYVITQPIDRFPAGLNGAHSVNFILGSGVPMPAGSPGHSRVISEETGKCLSRAPCR